MIERESQGLCDVTLTERFGNAACVCPTYAGNLGPCNVFERGANGNCVYCDHTSDCHVAQPVDDIGESDGDE